VLRLNLLKRFSSVADVPRPTLDDVAARAGVSRTLVSLTLRGLAGAGDGTRQAILDAAEQLGYVPDAAARMLASRSSEAIGVFLRDLHNAFYSDVIDGLHASMHESGFDVLMAVGDGLQLERSTLDTFRRYRMDGAVLIAPGVREREIEAFGDSTPTVVVGRPVRTRSVDVLVSDDRKGAVLAVEHLYELGHRDIAHLDGGTVPGGAGPRRAGYVDAMRRRGLERHVRIAGGGFTQACGADGVDELLRRRRPPTAIFAANDVVALGAMQRLAELGLSTPGDVSVVGYDNSSLAAQRRVGLTSIDQPRFEIGLLAAALLHERFDGRQRSSRHVLAPKLVERETTAPIGNRGRRGDEGG
jgi:DNA-binding LacI/PurR family transcriptional regulator